jgi:hypothetical protein
MYCMEDVNVSNALTQLLVGQVNALEYSHYDINRYHFWMAKLEVSHPLAATTNNKIETSGEDATATLPTIMAFFKIMLSTHSVALKS